MTHNVPIDQRRNGFTLIEVMISMALVLGLIIGINAVFKMAADTVGTGQALSAKMRDARAAQSVIYNDLTHAVTDGSEFRFLVIDSRTQFAFRDVRDMESDHDYNSQTDTGFINGPTGPIYALQDAHIRTIDLDGDNKDGNTAVPGEVIPVGLIGDREHRVDTLSFCAKDLFHRQTGNDGVFVDNMASQDAWITYGHGRVFNQQYDTPGANLKDDAHYRPLAAPPTTALPNPKNFYATDWALMRTVMLVLPVNINVVAGPPLDGIADDLTQPTPPNAVQTFWASALTGTTLQLKDLIPIGRNTASGTSTQTTASGGLPINSARYDVVPKDIRLGGAAGKDYPDIRDILTEYIEHTNYFIGTAGKQAPSYPDNWWDILPGSPSTDPSGSGILGRFRCNPYPTRDLLANPTTSSSTAASLASILMGNCTQFIVEFAGDYVTQSTKNDSTFGDITSVGPDGVTDFYIEQVKIGGKVVPQQRIRWYGFPRDVNSDGLVLGWSDSQPANPGSSGPNHNSLVDVVPLRDVIQSFDSGYYKNISTNKAKWDLVRFERGVVTSDPNLPATPDLPQPPNNKYIDINNPTTGLTSSARYMCAWGPNDLNKPTMLRIIFRIDDPNGRLADAQSSEFIIKLP